MQDDNTTQSNNDNGGDEASAGANVIEPTLGLGTNPSDPQVAGNDNTDDGALADQLVADENAVQDSTQTSDESVNTDTEKIESTEDSAQTPIIGSAPAGDLESIRSSALQELTPIISELDQEPEEKYRTLMMIIQASDNQSLVKEAYDAAEKIQDKKARAEALLTIVNEINYFTGKDKSQSED